MVVDGRQIRQSESARQVSDARLTRQLQDRQWIAPRLGHDPVDDPFVEPTGNGRLQQDPGVAVAQRTDLQLTQSRERSETFSSREDERDAFRQQTSGYERQDLDRSSVEPLRILYQTQQRPLIGCSGDEVQNPETDQEFVG